MKDIADKIAAEQSVRILGIAILPSRAFFTKKKMEAASDFSGLKIRSPQLDNWLASYSSLGANPTPVNWNEVSLALQTSLVEGGHGLPADTKPNNWHKAAPYITDLEDMLYDRACADVLSRLKSRHSGLRMIDQVIRRHPIDQPGALR